MCQIKSVANACFISIHEHLALLLKIGNQLAEYGLELQSVDYNINAIGLNYVSQRFLGILKDKLVFFFLFKLGSAEGTVYHDTGTSISFPLTATMSTLHLFSPPFQEFQNLKKIVSYLQNSLLFL